MKKVDSIETSIDDEIVSDVEDLSIDKILSSPEENSFVDDEENKSNISSAPALSPAEIATAKAKEKIEAIKEKKKTSWKRTFLRISAIIVFGILSGVIGGNWYYNTFLKSTVSYSQYSEDAYKDDRNEVIMAMTGLNTIDSTNVKNWIITAKANGITPEAFTLSQNFILAEYLGSCSQTFFIESTGLVNTILKQTVYSRRKFNGQKYTFESLSTGAMALATCSVGEVGKNNVDVIQGSITAVNEANWNGSTKSYTTAEYKEETGTNLDMLLPYIISSKTVKNNQDGKVTKTEDGYYEFSVQLDKITSVINYVRQVKFTSGLASLPEFTDITITFTLDENWNLVKSYIVEHYSIVYGIKVNCEGTLTSTYKFDEPVTMPV